ncbi:MAG: ATP-binding cassette domain-containing protein [Candidatus Methylarchaceae archaeon HK02M1]|nr:ATP-binding cassette domain-containing protein [Candidatus Methylarchaceae archaeon HK01M]MCP8311829.1 ATP-binding cassette domain-containing protein [Candidatus Methylarchaceae archaeon HK02M1]
MDAINVTNLTKTFLSKRRRGRLPFTGERIGIKALDELSLRVKDGDMVGLLGPNGAGKTTLIKILSTLIIPDSGTVKVNGYDILKDSLKVRESLGVMLTGERTLYWKLTGRENLLYFSRLYHVPKDLARRRIDELLALVGLKEKSDELVENYSTGQRVRLGFSKALINDAPIMLFDEPTMSLDPQFSRHIRNTIRWLNEEKGKTILLATQNMLEADELCHNISIIDQGKIIVSGSPSELKAKLLEKRSIKVIVRNLPIKEIYTENLLNDVKWTIKESDDGQSIMLQGMVEDEENALSVLLEMIAKKSGKVVNVTVNEPSLEDVFLKFTGRSFIG